MYLKLVNGVKKWVNDLVVGDGTNGFKQLIFKNNFLSYLKANPTSAQFWELPDKTGILALTSDVVYFGVNPPLNTDSFWFDTTTRLILHYDTNIDSWVSQFFEKELVKGGVLAKPSLDYNLIILDIIRGYGNNTDNIVNIRDGNYNVILKQFTLTNTDSSLHAVLNAWEELSSSNRFNFIDSSQYLPINVRYCFKRKQ